MPAATPLPFLVAPPLKRRVAVLVYEAVLLFGVLMLAGMLFAGLLQQRNALWFHWQYQLYLFVVLGAYFVFFWSRSGQTLAMQTWRIRVVDGSGQTLGVARASWRYVCCWLWFWPPLLLDFVLGLQRGAALTVLLGWLVLWAGLSRLRADRQFLHDALAGTRLLDMREASAPASSPALTPSGRAPDPPQGQGTP